MLRHNQAGEMGEKYIVLAVFGGISIVLHILLLGFFGFQYSSTDVSDKSDEEKNDTTQLKNMKEDLPRLSRVNAKLPSIPEMKLIEDEETEDSEKSIYGRYSELVYTSIDEARLPSKKASTEIKEENKVATTAKIERIASKESAIYDNIAQL
ncbi:Oidioi.mRNA.OKI2018_I69.PAR.g9389.t1.cds [Oikopleura dioica]|uniref:Oidioi.mRNA.OKI2018_I69.PAR.g9389.t1.cds n=1 Tax=Oikopleura dioica TaxID=34765 RepID=A0ABN7RMZ4_OIKDI|nr:Oidioi.mRNA.OKI2018_I69.PAR.g9389.t1.cds [Oikopleura dioica]